MLKLGVFVLPLQIAELAKSFLWEPFFPAYEADTLFHALLLFSKHHRLNVIPVVDQSKLTVSGFISQVNKMDLFLIFIEFQKIHLLRRCRDAIVVKP